MRETIEELRGGIGKTFSKTDRTFAKLWKSYIAPVNRDVNISHY
jgi:hypothetical protein